MDMSKMYLISGIIVTIVLTSSTLFGYDCYCIQPIPGAESRWNEQQFLNEQGLLGGQGSLELLQSLNEEPPPFQKIVGPYTVPNDSYCNDGYINETYNVAVTSCG
jgi:hypothetical protein